MTEAQNKAAEVCKHEQVTIRRAAEMKKRERMAKRKEMAVQAECRKREIKGAKANAAEVNKREQETIKRPVEAKKRERGVEWRRGKDEKRQAFEAKNADKLSSRAVLRPRNGNENGGAMALPHISAKDRRKLQTQA